MGDVIAIYRKSYLNTTRDEVAQAIARMSDAKVGTQECVGDITVTRTRRRKNGHNVAVQAPFQSRTCSAEDVESILLALKVVPYNEPCSYVA
jgi:hypothetical protein